MSDHAAGTRLWHWLTDKETSAPPTWFSRPLWPHVIALVAIFVIVGVVAR